MGPKVIKIKSALSSDDERLVELGRRLATFKDPVPHGLSSEQIAGKCFVYYVPKILLSVNNFSSSLLRFSDRFHRIVGSYTRLRDVFYGGFKAAVRRGDDTDDFCREWLSSSDLIANCRLLFESTPFSLASCTAHDQILTHLHTLLSKFLVLFTPFACSFSFLHLSH
jgi:hypothetical protein